MALIIGVYLNIDFILIFRDIFDPRWEEDNLGLLNGWELGKDALIIILAGALELGN